MELPGADSLQGRERSDADETFLSELTYDNQSLILLGEVDVPADELLDYDEPMVEDVQEVSLASRDAMSLRSSKKRPLQTIQNDENTVYVEYYLPSHSNARKKRRILVLLTILGLVGVIILSVALRRRERTKEGESNNENEKSVDLIEEQVIGTPAPSQKTPVPSQKDKPSSQPSSSPTSYAQQTLAYEIISSKIEDPTLLVTPGTPQYNAFQLVLGEGRTDPFRILQRFALMVVYFSTSGMDWEWKHGWHEFSEDECDWMGVAICRMQDHGGRAVASLSLDKNGLVGTLPSEICLLKDIENIVLPNNNLSGVLPPCLASLLMLEEIDVHNNRLSGQIPAGFFALPKLEYLVLSSNKFSGSLDALISDRFGKTRNIFLPAFQQLKVLNLEDNEFEGSIPDALFFLGRLEALTLHENMLVGNVDALCTHRLAVLSADCNHVVCTCCTACY